MHAVRCYIECVGKERGRLSVLWCDLDLSETAQLRLADWLLMITTRTFFWCEVI